MKKAEINKIKKAINQDKHYTTYYSSKTEELRITAYTYDDANGIGYNSGKYNAAKEKASILDILNKLTANGLRPKYRIDHKTYQGFIHCTYVVLQ